MEFQDEAIVLKSIDFRDHQKIVTLFTKSNGILSAIAKHLSPKNLRKNGLCAPLTRASYVLKSGRGDMVTIIDGNIIDAHLEARDSYPLLMTSFEILKIILKLTATRKSGTQSLSTSCCLFKRTQNYILPQQLTHQFYSQIITP